MGNDYTAAQDLEGADLLLDGFGDPEHPAPALAGPYGVAGAGGLDGATLRRLVAATRGDS
ncbi:MAG: hypothetical protein M3527_03285 [Actinomycetota bacterium]|nr:hypothetical protein [Acidimicrobiia bacterium]MDQ3293462.1 hypothetical protein [Actinomycetota bacterium]